MAYDIYFPRNADRRGAVVARLVLSVLFLALLVAFSMSGAGQPEIGQRDGAAPVAEGWHGNVRRSHWPNP